MYLISSSIDFIKIKHWPQVHACLLFDVVLTIHTTSFAKTACLVHDSFFKLSLAANWHHKSQSRLGTLSYMKLASRAFQASSWWVVYNLFVVEHSVPWVAPGTRFTFPHLNLQTWLSWCFWKRNHWNTTCSLWLIVGGWSWQIRWLLHNVVKNDVPYFLPEGPLTLLLC